MIILPAIDILDGKAVRLYQGDYATAERVALDPVLAAKEFEAAGAKYLHLVDLSGAKSGKTDGYETIRKIADAVNKYTIRHITITVRKSVDVFNKHIAILFRLIWILRIGFRRGTIKIIYIF